MQRNEAEKNLDTAKIRAVIFDMDGTLVLSNYMHFEAYQKVFDRYGVKANYEDFTQNLIGIGAYNVIKTVLERGGVNVDFAQLANIKKDIFNEMIATNGPKVVDGLYEFLDLIDAIKLERAVASAANKESILEVLTSINIGKRIPLIVSCEEVRYPKPSPDVFIEALVQINAHRCLAQHSHNEIRPEDCVVIEDTAHGIQAARAAGMFAIALLTTQSKERLLQAGAHVVCKDFFEVSRLFGRQKR